MKKTLKSLPLILSAVLITQFGCSTPTSTQSNTNTNIPSTTSTAQANPDTQPTRSQVSFSLTQKDEKGVSNPITPDTIESITVNGTTYKSSDTKISTAENQFSVKSWSGYWTWVNKKWVWTWVWSADSKAFSVSADQDDTELKVSFKLKGANNNIILPTFILEKLGGNIRIEANKNAAEEITGFSGGSDKDGVLDPTKPVFQTDFSTNKFIIIQPDGNKISFDLDNVAFDIKVDSKSEEKIIDVDKEIKNITDKVEAPNVASAFVGAWKSEILTLKSKLALKLSSASNIAYSATINNSLPAFNGVFSGNSSFTTNSAVNNLVVESTFNGKKFKGNLALTGDNSLTLTITETEAVELNNYVNIPFKFTRDI